MRGRDEGRSPTIHPALGPARGRDLADLAGRAVLGLVGRDLTGLVDLGLVDRVVLGLVGPGLQGLTGQADLGDRVDLDLVALADRVGLVDRDLVVPVGRVDLGPVGLVDLAVTDLAVLVDRGLLVGLEDPAVQDPTDLAVRVDLVVQGDRVDPVDPADRDLTGRVDRHRRRTGPKVLMIGVTPKWAAPLMRRTASAHPTMARRLRPGSTGSAGMADPLPEGLRLTGPGRRHRVAGTVLRLPVVGTLDGMGRHAT